MPKNEDTVRWIDRKELHNVEESFHEMTGMSIATVDTEGNLLTENPGRLEFCDGLINLSEKAAKLCRQCALYGAKESYDLKRGVPYYCPMGLTEFAMPVVIEDKTAAYLVGGRVFEVKPSEEALRERARYYGIDGEALIKAAGEVPVAGTEAVR